MISKANIKMLFIASTAGTTAYCVSIAPHTVFLEKYREIIARYHAIKEIPLTAAKKELVKQVMDDLKLSDEMRSSIKPFNVFGFDPYHAGTPCKTFGSILGIPANFYYSSVDTVKKYDILLNDKDVVWSNEDAQLFLESLVLSENAQKFAMAREILRIQHDEPSIKAILAGLLTTASVAFYSLFKDKFTRNPTRKVLKYAKYGALVSIPCIIYMGLVDLRSRNLDIKIDKELVKLNPNYIRGGKEFYDKNLKKNIALRTLLVPQGERMFSCTGNELTVRGGNIPLTERKQYFDSRLPN